MSLASLVAIAEELEAARVYAIDALAMAIQARGVSGAAFEIEEAHAAIAKADAAKRKAQRRADDLAALLAA